ncbi:MAG: acyl carrier protein [Saccharofermentanales bacterium]
MNELDRDSIRQSVLEIVSRVLDISPDSITEDMELGTDLKIDSLALYEIVVDIEDLFSLRISNDEADDLKTVGEAVDFIVKSVREA